MVRQRDCHARPAAGTGAIQLHYLVFLTVRINGNARFGWNLR